MSPSKLTCLKLSYVVHESPMWWRRSAHRYLRSHLHELSSTKEPACIETLGAKRKLIVRCSNSEREGKKGRVEMMKIEVDMTESTASPTEQDLRST